ncbi:hypothetical protein MRX96_009031 [Rhipicephalus microplus]
MGPKGDSGEKGDKGEKGDSGIDLVSNVKGVKRSVKMPHGGIADATDFKVSPRTARALPFNPVHFDPLLTFDSRTAVPGPPLETETNSAVLSAPCNFDRTSKHRSDILSRRCVYDEGIARRAWSSRPPLDPLDHRDCQDLTAAQDPLDPWVLRVKLVPAAHRASWGLLERTDSQDLRARKATKANAALRRRWTEIRSRRDSSKAPLDRPDRRVPPDHQEGR